MEFKVLPPGHVTIHLKKIHGKTRDAQPVNIMHVRLKSGKMLTESVESMSFMNEPMPLKDTLECMPYEIMGVFSI